MVLASGFAYGSEPVIARVLRRVLPNLPQEFQKNKDKTSPTAPTIISIKPAVWTLKPVVVTDTAKSKIAPTAMREQTRTKTHDDLLGHL